MFYSDVLLCLLFMYVLVLSLTVFLLVLIAQPKCIMLIIVSKKAKKPAKKPVFIFIAFLWYVSMTNHLCTSEKLRFDYMLCSQCSFNIFCLQCVHSGTCVFLVCVCENNS